MNYALENNSSTQQRKPLHPMQLAMWLGIASMIMIFGGWTSAYIVSYGNKAKWLQYEMPDIFVLSTFLILLSSVTLMLAKRAVRNGKEGSYKLFLGLTLILGIGFIVSQVAGWQWMYSKGLYLHTNSSTAFLFLLVGAHLAHLAAGIIIFLVTFINAIRRKPDAIEVLKDELRGMNRSVRLNLISTYWHFVDALWIYLFLFLLLNH